MAIGPSRHRTTRRLAVRRLAAAAALAGALAGCGDAPRGEPASATRPAAPAPPPAAVPESGYGAREVAGRRCTPAQRAFWTTFRTAALGPAIDSVVALVRFPFTLRGELDDAPMRRLDRSRFRAEWPGLLATDPRALGAVPGDDTTATSMRVLLERHPAPRDAWCIARGQMNVGTFGFLADDAGRFRLDEAYSGEP